MTTREFHKARRMFASYKNTFLLAPPNIELSHSEWFAELFNVEILIAEAVRGYVYENRIVMYQGTDFRVPDDLDAARRCYSHMHKFFSRLEEIGLGACPNTGQPWLPIKLDKISSCEWLWANPEVL